MCHVSGNSHSPAQNLAVFYQSRPERPFFADRLFKDLNAVTGRDKADSVHLARFPQVDESLIDPELEKRMERISGTLLIGTQMFSQLQQRQCIAEVTAKEQQCLVDYFAQLRPKRWQEWERKYNGLSTAQYIFLIMQDDLHFDDEAIATALNVKRTSVRSMRSRIKGREK